MLNADMHALVDHDAELEVAYSATFYDFILPYGAPGLAYVRDFVWRIWCPLLLMGWLLCLYCRCLLLWMRLLGSWLCCQLPLASLWLFPLRPCFYPHWDGLLCLDCVSVSGVPGCHGPCFV